MLGIGLSAPALGFTLTVPPGTISGINPGDRIHVAQQGVDAAQLAVRIQQLEEQIRLLTGEVEGLTFQVTQMQTLIERMREDTDFRLTQLEGGSVPTAPSGGATPAETSAPDGEDVAPTVIPEQGVVPLPGEQEFDPMFDDGSFSGAEDDFGASADPLLGTGQGGTGAVLGTVPGEGRSPLDLSFSPGMDTGNPDADAQFAAAYDAVASGDFAFAEDQFSLFLESFPENPQAPDAANWLGEALLQRGANEQAAEVLLDAYQRAPDGARAPDLLLRLGIALARAGERDTACRTFAVVAERYDSITAEFRNRLEGERATAQCPPA